MSLGRRGTLRRAHPGRPACPKPLPLWGGAGTLVAILALAGCGGPAPTDEGPPPPPTPGTLAISVLSAPDSAHAGDDVSIQIVVKRDGAPVPDVVVAVTVATGGGALDGGTVATDASGEASLMWHLGRELIQELLLEAEEATRTVRVRTPPVLASLQVASTDVRVTAVGSTIDLGVEARDRDDFVIPLPPDTRVEVDAATPAVTRLPVLGSTARHDAIGIEGPGTAVVRAVRGAISSAAVTIRVEPDLAIVDVLEAPAVVDPGTPLAFTGYRLDLLGPAAVTVGGSTAAPSLQTADRLEFAAPVRGDFGVCAGTAVAPIVVEGGLAPPSLGVRYRRDSEVALTPGEAHALGAAQSGCFSVAPGAEYLLLFADTRLITAAVTQVENDALRFTSFPLEVGAVGGPPALKSQGGRSVRIPTEAPGDVWRRPPPPPPPPSNLEADDYFRTPRTTPWAVGDGITIDLVDNGVFLQPHGRIVKVSAGGRLAVAVLDRDDPYGVEARLHIDAALAVVEDVTLPLLNGAFPLPRPPETTPGTGQVLMVVAGLDGEPVAGAAINDWILFAGPFVRASGVPIEIQPLDAAHEMAHVYQFAHISTLCTGLGICQDGPRSNWGMEGGAEYLAQESIRLSKGIRENANDQTPLFLYGSYSFFGCCAAVGTGAAFGYGYGGASWFVRDLVTRLRSQGVDFATAVGAVSRGAVEGWYGQLVFGGVWPGGGLSARLAPYFGANWDIVQIFLHGAASFALDDRVSATSGFGVPATLNSWQDLISGPEVRLMAGSGDRVVTQPAGTSFAWVLLDDRFLGGVYSFTTGAPDVQWLLVRVR